MQSLQTDVLIAGAGPCGLMLANELGHRGIKAVVLDPKPSTAFNPQANATQARTMEHFRRLGLAAKIRLLGLPQDHATDIAYFTRFSKYELARLRLPTAAQATVQIKNLSGAWSAAELPHRVSQKYVEGILREAADGYASNDIRFGHQLLDFAQDSEGVSAKAQRLEDGRVYDVRAKYLVGADGPRSVVRAALGLKYQGESGIKRQFMGGKMFAVYMRAPRFYELLPHPPAWMYVSVNHQRRVFMASVDGKGEFAFHAAVHAHEEAESWTERDAREIISQATGMDLKPEILSMGIWLAGHSLVCERYQGGRAFLAGDAAHLFTPTGGLGYNTAVGDAVNLGWKLAAVLKGQARATLLDTYELERRPIGLRNTAYARRFADSVGTYVVDEGLELDNEQGERKRIEAGTFLNDHVRQEFNIPGVTFGERYDQSPLVFSDPERVPADRANDYTPSFNPGGRLPHRWLESGASIFDLLNFEWTVVARESQHAAASLLVRVGQRMRVDVQSLLLTEAQADGYLDQQLLLVRPDQIIAWAGLSQEIDQAFASQIFSRTLMASELFDRNLQKADL